MGLHGLTLAGEEEGATDEADDDADDDTDDEAEEEGHTVVSTGICTLSRFSVALPLVSHANITNRSKEDDGGINGRLYVCHGTVEGSW